MRNTFTLCFRYKKMIAFAAIAMGLLTQSAVAESILSENYTIQIENPGFRMSVLTPTGVVLPADPTSGLSFLGSTAVSAERMSETGNITIYRVANPHISPARVDSWQLRIFGAC